MSADASDARDALDALIRERREDYAALSRMIGRNPAYIQQYVKRGTPRRLAEDDRRALADYFGVPEVLLGGPADRRLKVSDAGDGQARRKADLVAIPRFAIGASAGPGAIGDDRPAAGDIAFPPAFLRALGLGRIDALSMIRVAGDSMLPTLGDGDDILVDRGDGADRLRDGIYVLRVDDVLLVKRVALKPGGGLAILSDNPASPDWSDIDRATLTIVGRVVWAGRRLT